MLKKSLFLFSLILLFGQPVFADDITAIGKYITVFNKPKPEQVDLLHQTIQVRFPQNVMTIGDACNDLLKISGYSFVDINKRNESLKITLSKPLPLIDRDFGPMSLKDALTTLMGPAFTLTSDPVSRTVNFKLKGNKNHE